MAVSEVSFNSEEKLREYLCENYTKYFPGELVGSEVFIGKGCMVDIVGKNNNATYLIEVKPGKATKLHVDQAARYADVGTEKFNDAVGAIAAPAIEKSARSYAKEKAVEVFLLEDVGYKETMKTTLYLENDLWKRVRRIAFDRGVSATHIVEQALQEKLAREGG